MMLIKAWLSHNGVRKHSIQTGYRPLFFFDPKNPTSGAIRLLDREMLLPGDKAIVEITPVSPSLVGDPGIGEIIRVGESPDAIVGQIEIIELIKEDKD